MGSPDSFLLDPIDMDHFFDEERRKFYGYKGLKVIISCFGS